MSLCYENNVSQLNIFQCVRTVTSVQRLKIYLPYQDSNQRKFTKVLLSIGDFINY